MCLLYAMEAALVMMGRHRLWVRLRLDVVG